MTGKTDSLAKQKHGSRKSAGCEAYALMRFCGYRREYIIMKRMLSHVIVKHLFFIPLCLNKQPIIKVG